MARYIDADLLLEELEDNTPLNWTDSEREQQEQFDYQVFKHMIEYQPTVENIVKEIFKKIKRELEEAIKNNYEVRHERLEKHGEILDEFDNHIYGKILALDGMLGFIEHLEEEYGIVDEEEKGECACNKCFHNCTTFCDFTNHCKKKFMELDEETDRRLGLISE